jgi:hypothetical protein
MSSWRGLSWSAGSGSAEAMKMPEGVLNEPARDLLSLDHPGLNRVLRALELNAGTSYMDAYDKFSKASEDGGTVRQALETLGVTKKLDAIATDLVTLEKADEARAKLYELDSGAVTNSQRTDQADSAGRSDHRMVGSSTLTEDDGLVPITPAVYEAVMNQPHHSARYFEAKGLNDSAYNDAQGPARWLNDDQLAAKAGFDALASLKKQRRAASTARARADANRRLDAAFEGKSPSKRAIRLEAAISESKKVMLDAPGGKKAAKAAKKAAKRQHELDEAAKRRADEYAAEMKKLTQEDG